MTQARAVLERVEPTASQVRGIWLYSIGKKMRWVTVIERGVLYHAQTRARTQRQVGTAFEDGASVREAFGSKTPFAIRLADIEQVVVADNDKTTVMVHDTDGDAEDITVGASVPNFLSVLVPALQQQCAKAIASISDTNMVESYVISTKSQSRPYSGKPVVGCVANFGWSAAACGHRSFAGNGTQDHAVRRADFSVGPGNDLRSARRDG